MTVTDRLFTARAQIATNYGGIALLYFNKTVNGRQTYF